MRIFFSAGEASGDLHAAGVIRNIKRLKPDTDVWFLGGDNMTQAAGRKPLIHYRDMAYMGFTEVAKHLPEISRNLKITKKVIAKLRPDAVVLVDYPGFNMKIAKAAKELGIPVYYYISPKVWAWKEYRVKAMKRDVDAILSILPFEPRWFAKRGVKATYVGNPSVEEVENEVKTRMEDTDILALVPGSRIAEIRSNLPVMAEVAKRHPELKPMIASAPNIDTKIYRGITDIPLADCKTLQLMADARAALVTSGTASLECALVGTPQVVCYRSNGMKLTYSLMSNFIHLPAVSLPNLVAGNFIPEMLIHHCNPEEVDAALTPLLTGTPQRAAQLKGYAKMKSLLATKDSPADTAAKCILGVS